MLPTMTNTNYTTVLSMADGAAHGREPKSHHTGPICGTNIAGLWQKNPQYRPIFIIVATSK